MGKSDGAVGDLRRPLEPEEKALLEAKVLREQAEIYKLQAETRTSELFAQEGTIRLEMLRDKREEDLAQNEYHHVYVFDTDVNETSVKRCIQQLTTWTRKDPECNIEIVINSPGGSIFDGFALVDFLRDLRSKGHHITMVALGMAASMGGVLLQAGDTRVMGANCMMLIHEGSFGAIGDFGKVEDRVKLMEHFHDRILTLFEERAKEINPKTTKAFIQRRWQRKDWWLQAGDALKFGFIDEIR